MNVDKMRRQLRRVGVPTPEPERFIPGFQEAIVAMEQRYQEELKVKELADRFREAARQVDIAGPDRLTRQIRAFRDDAARAEAELQVRQRIDDLNEHHRGLKSWLPW